LAHHPEASVTAITSRSEAGVSVADMFPNLRGHFALAFSEPNIKTLGACDVVFFATPNAVAMTMTRELLEAGVKVIDLSADFRLKDVDVWNQWYGKEHKQNHTCPDLLAEAVYGLPEVNRDQIKTARLVANPGCYPTAVQLGFLPLIKHKLVDTQHLIADAKSGVSGAGRSASVSMLMCETADSFKAYKVDGHRHLPEITQGLTTAAGHTVGVTFVPHLVPMIRGIQATLYAKVTSDSDLQSLYESFYKGEPFVDVMPKGSHPETRSVKGANTCRIAVHRPQGGNTAVVLSVIDNLVKGAAGQAIQNMNLMFGLDEATSLAQVALLP